jgi:hypothetical protein
MRYAEDAPWILRPRVFLGSVSSPRVGRSWRVRHRRRCRGAFGKNRYDEGHPPGVTARTAGARSPRTLAPTGNRSSKVRLRRGPWQRSHRR